MSVKIYFKDDTISTYNDVEFYIVSKLTVEIHHYNGTFRTIPKQEIKIFECE